MILSNSTVVSMVSYSKSTDTIIVGERPLFREGVAALLRNTPYKVIASVHRCSELKDVHASADPRTLIILGGDGDDDGLEASRSIGTLRGLFPKSIVIVIAETRLPTNFQELLTAAPDGYVANLTSREVLIRLLEVALLGQRVIVLPQPKSLPTLAEESSSVRRPTLGNGNARYDARDLSADEKDPKLSQREREILIRLAQGGSNKEIARVCNIAEATVKVHLKAILRKTTAHNRTQAAIWAIAKGYPPHSG